LPSMRPTKAAFGTGILELNRPPTSFLFPLSSLLRVYSERS
jgi:hypothetical protein